MDKQSKDKLLDCRSMTDARPILETVKGLSNSAYTLAETAYAIREKQPDLARSFIDTIIREMEDHEKDKKIEETDENTDHQSSSTEGLEKIGKEHNAPEASKEQPEKKDQMGVPINESNGYPPAPMGQPTGHFQENHQCNGQPPQNGQMPPNGQIPQPMQQMQYTVQETQKMVNRLASGHDKIVEALKAMDKKVQETLAPKVNSLEMSDRLGGKGQKSNRSIIRETTGDSERDLATIRREISELNKQLSA